MKETCEQQEQLINKLKCEFGSVQEERQNEIENKLNEVFVFKFFFVEYINQL